MASRASPLAIKSGIIMFVFTSRVSPLAIKTGETFGIFARNQVEHRFMLATTLRLLCFARVSFAHSRAVPLARAARRLALAAPVRSTRTKARQASTSSRSPSKAGQAIRYACSQKTSRFLGLHRMILPVCLARSQFQIGHSTAMTPRASSCS